MASSTSAESLTPPTDVRRRILAAALELFAERGFASTTTASIAQRAGVAEKTIFSHFKTKDSLFEQTISPATVELLVPEWPDPLRSMQEEPSSLEDFFFGLMKNRMAVYRRYPDKFKLIVQESLLRPERATQFFSTMGRQSVPKVEKVLRRLQEQGELRDVPFALVHGVSLSLLFGYAIATLVLWPHLAVEDEIEIRRIVQVLVSGLRPVGAPRRARSATATERSRRKPTRSRPNGGKSR